MVSTIECGPGYMGSVDGSGNMVGNGASKMMGNGAGYVMGSVVGNRGSVVGSVADGSAVVRSLSDGDRGGHMVSIVGSGGSIVVTSNVGNRCGHMVSGVVGNRGSVDGSVVHGSAVR
jgi:hypothetical protein